MKLREIRKIVGSFAVGVAFLSAITVLGVLFFNGAAWVSERILPVVNMIVTLSLMLIILLSLVFAWFRKTRRWLGVAMTLWATLCLFDLWMYSLLLTMAHWGKVWTIVGLFFFGVGVIPMALISSLFSRDWVNVATIVAMCILFVIAHIIGTDFADSDSN